MKSYAFVSRADDVAERASTPRHQRCPEPVRQPAVPQCTRPRLHFRAWNMTCLTPWLSKECPHVESQDRPCELHHPQLLASSVDRAEHEPPPARHCTQHLAREHEATHPAPDDGFVAEPGKHRGWTNAAHDLRCTAR